MQERSVGIEHRLKVSFEELKQRIDKARMEAADLLSERERSSSNRTLGEEVILTFRKS